MAMSPCAVNVVFGAQDFTVELADGRALTVPLDWFPVLRQATPEQRQKYHINTSGSGLHWRTLDEDISVEGLLRGQRDATNR
jgi:hypothetical protein